MQLSSGADKDPGTWNPSKLAVSKVRGSLFSRCYEPFFVASSQQKSDSSGNGIVLVPDPLTHLKNMKIFDFVCLKRKQHPNPDVSFLCRALPTSVLCNQTMQKYKLPELLLGRSVQHVSDCFYEYYNPTIITTIIIIIHLKKIQNYFQSLQLFVQ